MDKARAGGNDRGVLSGRLDRRALLRRSFVLGISVSGLSLLLPACGSSESGSSSSNKASTAPTATAVTSGSAPASSAAATSSKSSAVTKATLRLNYTPNAEHAPYYLGKQKGYYKDSGIDIDILAGQGSATTTKLVGTGDSMFGVAVADAVTVGRGQGISVVSTAVLLQDSPTVLVALKESGIKEPQDLYGKRVAVNPQSTVYAYWVAFTVVNKLDRSKIKEVNVTGASIPLLVSKDIDATGALLTNEVVTLQQQGHDLNIIHYPQYGVNSYGQVLFTSNDFLTKQPDLVERFTKATMKSWEYSIAHVDEAIDALAQAVPETDKKLETAKWGPIKELVQGPKSEIPFGHQALDKWTQTYQTFKTGGMIDKEFDPKDLFTDKYSS